MKQISPLQPPATRMDPDKTIWAQLHGSSAALAILSTAQARQSALLILTYDNQTAQQLADDLLFFSQRMSDVPAIHTFPDWETLPYDHFSPHQDIISQRLLMLSHLATMSTGIIITAISTVMHRLAPESYLLSYGLVLHVGQEINIDHFRQRLIDSGYRMVTQVMEHGECAVRGAIIDIFPMGSSLPYRIDLFDNEIDSIRTFDPDNQRSLDKSQQINLLPAHEFPVNEAGINQFRQQWRQKFSGDPRQCPIYQQVSDGNIPGGIEYYLPLFFDSTTSFFDYLPANTLIMHTEKTNQSGEHFWDEIKQRYEQQRSDIQQPLLNPLEIFIPTDQVFASCNRFSQIYLQEAETTAKAKQVNFATEPPPQLLIDRKAKQPLKTLANYLHNTTLKVLFCAESIGRREVLHQLLQDIKITPTLCDSWHDFIQHDINIGLTYGALTHGLCLNNPDISVITESQIFGQQVAQQRRRQQRVINTDNLVRDLTELQIGAPVVHLQHGVGRYSGLQALTVNEQLSEFLILEYAGNDKIYVPVTSLHLINRYTGVDAQHAPLNKLGAEQWAKAKKKAISKIIDVAAELLDLYARRQAQKGVKYILPESYQAFATSFPFEETLDQERAIEQIKQDLLSEQPMDRLICGDVGFGKTEVAMRAAFIVAHNNKQVAILVPTTLLAEQHYKNFQDRFADFAVNIELVSRFRTQKQQKEILSKLQIGTIDIIIGTHKLLQKGIAFKNLGLIIVDEEHRFGVRQKEKLISLRANVDVLSLTATPIPRTLNMAMSGIRDISLITTPPAKRLAIKTFCQEENKKTIREAILREIFRGGQVFYLHNKVETIQHAAVEIEQLVPEAKVVFAHAQMRERTLEQIMVDFYHQRFNVLVCTTIIESGIDIPTANTIVIDRADRFGLAQLHQLRGRVGRSHHQAYAYLIIPEKKALGSDAKKRLDAIMSLEDLGAGFNLATHDLEIRGSGELLGEEQSGHIQAIGFSLYMELLDRAVKALKSGQQPEIMQSLDQSFEINLQITTIIPDDYIADVHTRLILYKRIANAENPDTLSDLQVEMIDRFGLLPDSVKYLFRVTELKLMAQPLGIKKIDANSQGVRIAFIDEPNIDTSKLLTLVQANPLQYQLAGSQTLRFNVETTTPEARIASVVQLLQQLV